MKLNFIEEIDREIMAACIIYADTCEYEYLGYEFDNRNIRLDISCIF